jgi:hypothetical protein
MIPFSCPWKKQVMTSQEPEAAADLLDTDHPMLAYDMIID